MELLPEPGRTALKAFCGGDRQPLTIRALRRHKLLVWEKEAWHLTRLGLHAARHYKLGELAPVQQRPT
jgi:hypothetical protein